MKILIAMVLALGLFFPQESQAKYLYDIKVCSEVKATKCVSAPVKSTKTGKKVRLPGGTWVDCAGDCRYTLRKKTVDYWHYQWLRN